MLFDVHNCFDGELFHACFGDLAQVVRFVVRTFNKTKRRTFVIKSTVLLEMATFGVHNVTSYLIKKSFSFSQSTRLLLLLSKLC